MRLLLPKGEKNLEAVGWTKGDSDNPVLMVSFDVAVTATEGTQTRGGIGVVSGTVVLRPLQ